MVSVYPLFYPTGSGGTTLVRTVLPSKGLKMITQPLTLKLVSQRNALAVPTQPTKLVVDGTKHKLKLGSGQKITLTSPTFKLRMCQNV